MLLASFGTYINQRKTVQPALDVHTQNSVEENAIPTVAVQTKSKDIQIAGCSNFATRYLYHKKTDSFHCPLIFQFLLKILRISPSSKVVCLESLAQVILLPSLANPVATTVIFISSCILSSKAAPQMIVASG